MVCKKRKVEPRASFTPAEMEAAIIELIGKNAVRIASTPEAQAVMKEAQRVAEETSKQMAEERRIKDIRILWEPFTI